MQSLTLPESTDHLMLDAALRGLLILIVAISLHLCLRRAAAAKRHLVLSLATIGLIVVPVLTALLPGWQLPALTGRLDPATTAVKFRPTTSEAFVLRQETTGLPAHMAEQPTELVQIAPRPVAPAVAMTVDPPTRNRSPAASQDPESRLQFTRATQWIPALWLTGTVVLLIPFLVGFFRLWRVGRSAQPVDDSGWDELLAELCGDMGVHRRVLLRQCSIVSVPMTWGMTRPIILLPDDAVTWPASRRRIVLLHELAHVKRFDWVTNLIAELACALHWFNPLAWIVVRWLHLDGERACDDRALQAGAVASDYAAELLHFVNRLQSRSSARLRALSIARRSSIERRIVGILDPTRSRRPVREATVVGAFIVCLALLAPLAMVRVFDRGAIASEPAETEFAGDEPEAIGEPDAPAEQTIPESPNAPHRGVAATDEQLNLPFGPALDNGLRVAWAIEPAQDSYAEGDFLRSTLFFHNSGTKAIQFKRLQESLYDIVRVRFPDGRVSQVMGIAYFRRRSPQYFVARLEPGEIIEVVADRLAIDHPDTNPTLRELPVSAGDRVEAWIDIPVPEFQLSPETAPGSNRLVSAPITMQITDGEPNTTVRVQSAIEPGVYPLTDGIRLQLRKDVDPEDSPANAVTIQWFDGDSAEPSFEQTINVPALDRDFGVAWGEGRGAYRLTAAHRFWIAKANAVQLISIFSPEDVRIANYGWSLHENFGLDVYESSTMSANYGGIPAVVMSRLESLRPQQGEFARPDSNVLQRLDLSDVPVRTYWDTLRNTPDLYVPDPDQRDNWSAADDVFGIPAGEHLWVKYPFRTGRFYVEYRPDGSWENEQTYGPIAGNPFEQLALEERLTTQLRSSSLGGDAPYRLRRMFRTGSEDLIRRACGVIATKLEGDSDNNEHQLFVAIELLEVAREAMRLQPDAFALPRLQPGLERTPRGNGAGRTEDR